MLQKNQEINRFTFLLNNLLLKLKYPQLVYQKLSPHLSTIECMLLDSSLKNIPLERTQNTLLLLDDAFIRMLQNISETIGIYNEVETQYKPIKFKMLRKCLNFIRKYLFWNMA